MREETGAAWVMDRSKKGKKRVEKGRKEGVKE